MNRELLLKHFDRISEAPNAVLSLRRFVLDLAVRGKLVEQNPADEPASKLLKRIEAEKSRLSSAGKIKEARQLRIANEFAAPYQLPISWKWVTLSQIVDSHRGGGTPSKNNSSYWGGDVLWASVKDVGKAKYIEDTIDRITEAGLADSSSNLIPPGNLIIVTRMGLGKVSINRVPLAINQDLRALALSSLVAIDFYYTFFRTHGFEGTGLTVKGIRLEELLSVPVPLPPIAEQRRIVAKVEELMALCDRLEASQEERDRRRDLLAAASLHRINNAANTAVFSECVRFYINYLPQLSVNLRQIKQLRQTVLNMAVLGKLVPPLEPGTADDALAIVKSQRRREGHPVGAVGPVPQDEIPGGPGFPSTWQKAALSDVVLAIVDCPHSTPQWTSDGKMCVRTNQFRPGFLDLSDSRFVSEESYRERIQRLKPREDDILYSREGGILGIACRVPPGADLCLGQRMMLIRASSIHLPSFLELVLNSPLITTIATSETTGGAAPRVNVSTIRAYPIPIPPLIEQKHIVAKVTQLMTLCDQLETELTGTATIRRSLLEAVLYEALESQPAPVLAAS